MTTAEITPEGIEAPHGEKTIEVRIRFWTDEIAPNGVLPKHAWDWGTVRVKPNSSHGIRSIEERHFHSMAELGLVIEQTLVDHGIKLHRGTFASKLYAN
jgi:hypothetical protein